MKNGLAIETMQLEKRFGDLVAINKISLKISHGIVFGLLGPNGAGKTTTIRILATILVPTSGTASVNGCDVVRESRGVRESIGVLPEDVGLYDRLTGYETLRFAGLLYGLKGMDLEERISRVLKILDLDGRGKDRVGKYSRGMKQKLALARALIHDPPILMLDEPTLGLDVMSARTIREYIRGAAKEGRTVLLTTHNMSEAQLLCEQIAIINRGSIVATGTVEELEGLTKSKDLEEVFVNLVRDQQ